jgi:hypothetical protein
MTEKTYTQEQYEKDLQAVIIHVGILTFADGEKEIQPDIAAAIARLRDALPRYTQADMDEAVAHIQFLLTLLPEWAECSQPGLDPTMYGTGSYEDDLTVISKVEIARAFLDRHKEKTT